MLQLNKRHAGAPRAFEATGRRSHAGLFAGCGGRHNNQRDAANILMWIESDIYSKKLRAALKYKSAFNDF